MTLPPPLAATSSAASQTFSSPLEVWAHTQQAKPHGEADSAQQNSTELFMAMLKSVSSNPLGDTDPSKGMQIIQDMIRTQASIKEGERLKDMVQALQDNNRLQAANLVGKSGQFYTNSFSVSANHKDAVSYEVPEGSHLKGVVIDVFNGYGQKIQQLSGPATDGLHTLDSLVNTLPEGRYHLQVSGTAHDDRAVALSPLITSKLTRVVFEGGKIWAGSSSSQLFPLESLKGLAPHSAAIPSILEGALSHANIT
ncbi:hypothetical protein EIL50_04090 [bacterium NHP-B]|nr:hypothetical protein EIL50_04090 [bacterium NHP-B]